MWRRVAVLPVPTYDRAIVPARAKRKPEVQRSWKEATRLLALTLRAIQPLTSLIASQRWLHHEAWLAPPRRQADINTRTCSVTLDASAPRS